MITRDKVLKSIKILFEEKYKNPKGRRISSSHFIHAHFPNVWRAKKLSNSDVVKLLEYLIASKETGFCCPNHNQNRAYYHSERRKIGGTKGNKWARYIRNEILMGRAECQLCQSRKDLTLDHIVPLGSMGKSEPSNIAVLCQDCNDRKADSTMDLIPFITNEEWETLDSNEQSITIGV